jgi:predicted TIM-barrel fold metal-dependent hydrolase
LFLTERRHPVYRGFPVYDADTHINEPEDLWQRHMAKKFSDRAPRVVDIDGGPRQAWVFGDERVTITSLINVAGQSPVSWQAIAPEGMRGLRPGGWDPAERLKDMNIDMVDSHVLFPSYTLIMARAQADARGGVDRDFHLAFVAAYNDWLSEFCSFAPDRLIGLAIVPLTGIDDAIAEAERARQLPGIHGVAPLSWPAGGAGPTKDDDRFWSLLEDLGLPLNVHIGFGEVGGADPDLPRDPDMMARLVSMPVINRERTASSMMPVLSEFILGGILERHPQLRLAIVESGIGWIPFWCEQTDDNFLRHRFWTHCELPLMPSDYWRRQCTATFQVDSYGVRNRDLMGTHTICWTSDYPHSGADWPNSQRTIASQLADVPDADVEQIVGGNLKRLYQLS